MSLRSWLTKKNDEINNGIALEIAPPPLRPDEIRPVRMVSPLSSKPLPNKAADMSQRGDVVALINEPIRVVIGTHANPRIVLVTEPPNAEFGEYAALLNAALSHLVKANMPLIQAAMRGESVDKLSLDLAPLDSALDILIAKIVGEDVAFVRNEMTKKQSVAIVHAFLDALGWDFIKENFRLAATAWKRAAQKASKNGSDVEPPWPQKQSQESAEPIPR